MLEERSAPRTKGEIDFLLDTAFNSKGWKTIKVGIGWLVTITIEGETNPYEIMVQNMVEYVSLSIILCSDTDIGLVTFLKDIAEKLNEKLPAKDYNYVPSRISIINNGHLHRLVSIQAFDGKYASDFDFNCCLFTTINNLINMYSLFESALPAVADTLKKVDESATDSRPVQQEDGGCYIATAVYGSYDCPEVWTLRRFRDYTLAETWYGRLFIKIYYTISPTIVKWFGRTNWFKIIWRPYLDKKVLKLHNNGVESTPYEDKKW